MDYSPECLYIFEKLQKELPAHLEYHTLGHTLDVYAKAAFIAREENVAEIDTKWLLTAAAYHDAGYLKSMKGHEEISCIIARESLSRFGYSESDLELVCNIIMATKLPQRPVTHLQEIICDADLDYLGRDDFFTTGNGLFSEMMYAGVVKDEKEWDRLQIQFLEEHRYFTATSQQRRNERKLEHLNILKAKLQTS